jgi:phosphatidylserine decarboxylase
LAKATVISPVDGVISQMDSIHSSSFLHAKNHSFQLNELLASHLDKVALFKHGLFCTLYLSPRDYHRIHMPMAGRLTDMIYVPGRLFSVNQRTARTVPNLFSRNERVICLFATERGPLALILIGALFVGSMETVWAGSLPPSSSSQPQHWRYPEVDAPVFKQGDEIGRFNMGSTVILLLDGQQITWNLESAVGTNVLMGHALAR